MDVVLLKILTSGNRPLSKKKMATWQVGTMSENSHESWNYIGLLGQTGTNARRHVVDVEWLDWCFNVMWAGVRQKLQHAVLRFPTSEIFVLPQFAQ